MKEQGTDTASGEKAAADNAKIRIALFTVMDFSINTVVSNVIDKRTDVEVVVVVTCTGPKSRRSDAHLEVVHALWDTGHYNVDVVISNKKSKYSEIMLLYKIDMIMSIGYPWLLPEDILTPGKYPGSPRLGAVNFHNSLLPEYRGPNAFGSAICNGDPMFGFCSHRMDGQFDTGAVLVTMTMKNEINETVADLFPKLDPLFCAMVQKSIDMMIAGEPGTPQVGEGSDAPKFTDEFRWIDFAGSTSLEIHNKVRAFYGVRDIPKGALAKIDGQDICITRTFYRDGQEVSSSPGEITAKTEDGKTFFVQCKDTTLEVLEWHEQERQLGCRKTKVEVLENRNTVNLGV